MLHFQDLVNHILWEVDIGNFDVFLEVLFLSSYLSMTLIGHLEKVRHIFRYLKTHPKMRLGFDPEHPIINENCSHYC